jgi:putative endonuclease
MFNWFTKSSIPQKPKTLGQLGEEAAQEEYKKRGFNIIAANEYNKKGKRLGEIDFIAKNKDTIVFVEVKTRTAGVDKFGKGVEAVNIYKQQKILRAVKMYFLRQPKMLEFKPQIDVCLMEYSKFDKSFKPAIIIPNAVEDWN